jgi:glycine hydroxymethyltransferase
VAHRLARANIITNKNLIPSDTPADWDRPGGLRMGTTEVTRLGMREPQMEGIAEFIAQVLIERVAPEAIVDEVQDFRRPYQTLFYCVEQGLPPH